MDTLKDLIQTLTLDDLQRRQVERMMFAVYIAGMGRRDSQTRLETLEEMKVSFRAMLTAIPAKVLEIENV